MLAILAAVTLAAGPPVILDARRPGPIEARACKPSGRYEVSDPALLYRHDGKARLTRLGDLPRANHEKAVLRTVDGCSAPLVVRYRVGP